MVRESRWVLLLSCGMALGLALYVYFGSPEVVPVHFGPDGAPDRWGTPNLLLRVHATIVGLATVLFLLLPEFIRRAPAWAINLPRKDYWLRPEHRDVAADKFAVWGHAFGTALNVLILTLQLVLSDDGDASEPSTLPMLVVCAFLAFVLLWSVGVFLAYRVPPESAG